MAVTITNQKMFSTSANTVVANGKAKASFSFFIRPDNLAGPANWANVAWRAGYNTFYFTILGTATPGIAQIKGTITNGTSSVVGSTNAAQGSVVHVALTYDQGTQTFWVNGVPTVIGTLSGNTQGNNVAFQVGYSAATPTVVYTLHDLAIWNDYVLTATDVQNLRDGIQTPPDIGGTATWRGRWTLCGTVGAAPVLGDAGLANDFGDATTNLTSITGSGTAVYASPLVWSPCTRVSEAHIGSSGETLFVYLSSISTGGDAIASSEVIRPALYVNGTSVGTLGTPWISGHHRCIMYPLPSGVLVGPSDIATFSAASGWMNTAFGLAQAETSISVTNYSGRGVYSSKYPGRNLKVGINHTHPPSSAGFFQVPKNWLYRTDAFTQCTLDSTGKPTAMNSTTAGALLFTSTGDNGIDSTKMMGATGLFAVGWDDLNTSVPTSFYIYTIDSNTTVTERTDLRNYGSGGLGQVRVFDVELVGGATRVDTTFSLGMSNSAKTPQFANLVVYGPGDFTPTAPIVLDKSNPFSAAARYKDWTQNPPGSMRWVDSVWHYDGATTASEPEDMRNLSDFSWGNGIYKRSGAAATIGYTQARPWSLPAYVYSKHFGSPFSATLASNIDAVTTTLMISDAATAPVFTGLQLTIDSEKMEVVDVSGTTVTVKRGTSSTTAASHSAGTITVNNRFQVTSYSQLALANSGLIAEMVSQNPHKLRSGNFALWSGTGWPTMTFTDGTTKNFQGSGRVLFVTGPNSYVFSQWSSVSAPVTLSTTYTLNPANQYTWYLTPEAASFPVEFVAKATGSAPGCDLHINVPMAASDSMVDEIACRVRDNFPSGRNVWVELSNEVWRDYSAIVWFNTVAQFVYPSDATHRSYFVQRVGEVCQRFRDRFKENGPDRSAEIKALVGVAQRDPSDSANLLNIAQTLSPTVRIDGVAAACYIACDYTTTATVNAYAACDTPQAVDLWIHDFAEWNADLVAMRASVSSQIASYNAATGYNCVLYGYESGVDFPLPSTVTNYLQRERDMVYHPNWYFAEQDVFALWQKIGYQRINILSISIEYAANAMWGIYHSVQQDHGRGDGSDGKADNRLCQATPEQPHTKSATTNQDQQCVSVRGQALLDWLKPTPRRRIRFVPRPMNRSS
jgi:hypothetical protein